MKLDRLPSADKNDSLNLFFVFSKFINKNGALKKNLNEKLDNKLREINLNKQLDLSLHNKVVGLFIENGLSCIDSFDCDKVSELNSDRYTLLYIHLFCHNFQCDVFELKLDGDKASWVCLSRVDASRKTEKYLCIFKEKSGRYNIIGPSNIYMKHPSECNVYKL